MYLSMVLGMLVLCMSVCRFTESNAFERSRGYCHGSVVVFLLLKPLCDSVVYFM